MSEHNRDGILTILGGDPRSWPAADLDPSEVLAEHRIVGVGLCSCGDTYTLRWLTRDEWWTDHLASHGGLCSSCGGRGGDSSGPCWDCQGGTLTGDPS